MTFLPIRGGKVFLGCDYRLRLHWYFYLISSEGCNLGSSLVTVAQVKAADCLGCGYELYVRIQFRISNSLLRLLSTVLQSQGCRFLYGYRCIVVADAKAVNCECYRWKIFYELGIWIRFAWKLAICKWIRSLVAHEQYFSYFYNTSIVPFYMICILWKKRNRPLEAAIGKNGLRCPNGVQGKGMVTKLYCFYPWNVFFTK